MYIEKNKIKYSNMMTRGFLDAAYHLKNCEKRDGWLLGLYAPAYTANLAFACELYFKQILFLNKISTKENGKNIHGLKKLFMKIPVDIQQEIEAEYNKRMTTKALGIEPVQFLNVKECLDMYNTAFEDWRYIYEGGKECNTVAGIEFFNLVDAVQKIVDEKVNDND